MTYESQVAEALRKITVAHQKPGQCTLCDQKFTDIMDLVEELTYRRLNDYRGVPSK